MRHFWYLDIAKSDATLLHVLRIQHYILQKSAVSTQGLSLKAILFQSTTASIYYKEIVQSLKRMPHHFMQCVRYSTLSKEYCIPLGTFVTVTGKTLSKYCCIYWAFCYKEMLHVLKEIPHHSPNSVCFPVYPWSIWKGLWQKQRCWRDVSLQRYTMAQKKLL